MRGRHERRTRRRGWRRSPRARASCGAERDARRSRSDAGALERAVDEARERRGRSSACRIRRNREAQSGTTVIENRYEPIIANATASARGAKRNLAIPARNTTGKNTTMTVEGDQDARPAPISRMPSSAASKGFFPISRCRTMFSMATMPSSRISPGRERQPAERHRVDRLARRVEPDERREDRKGERQEDEERGSRADWRNTRIMKRREESAQDPSTVSARIAAHVHGLVEHHVEIDSGRELGLHRVDLLLARPPRPRWCWPRLAVDRDVDLPSSVDANEV